MSLTRDTWPSATALRASLMAQFSLPPVPPAVHTWMAWYATLAPEQSLFLGDGSESAGAAAAMGDEFGEDDFAFDATHNLGVLTGVPTVDLPSLFHALDGYRFVLDHQRSSPDHLVWRDMAATGREGDWQPHWLVLQNAGGDPLIADVRSPTVPIYLAMHGTGRWDAQLLYDSLDELMAAITVYVPAAPGDPPRQPSYTVQLLDWGPQTMQVLLTLKQLDAFRSLGNSELLQLKQALPLTLLRTSNAARKDSVLQRFAALGARLRVEER